LKCLLTIYQKEELVLGINNLKTYQNES
jgi:hypothetical protein